MDQVNVTWSDFSLSVPKLFNRHRIEERYTDVTLVSDDNQLFRAHKLVLSAGSQYFDKILEETRPHPYPIYPMLCLDGINSEDLSNILEYIYYGEIMVPETDLQRFLKVATKLKCLGLNVSKQEEGELKTVVKDQPFETENTTASAELTYPEIFENPEKLHYVSIEDIEQGTNRGMTKEIVSSNILLTPKNEQLKVSNLLSKTPEICKIEGEIFSIIDLKKMIQQLYRKDQLNLFHCLKCPKIQNSKSHVEAHVQTHIKDLEFQCYDCNKIFRTYDGKRKHSTYCKFRKETSLKTKHLIRGEEEGEINQPIYY